MKKDCVFCNFKVKDILVYEDKLCYSIISKDPINKYHILVIPKVHYENFTELPNKTVSHIFLVAKKLSKVLRKLCKPDAITYISEDDISKKGYNLVEHYKLHIFPRFKEDMKKVDWSKLRTNNVDMKTLSEYAKDIKKLLK